MVADGRDKIKNLSSNLEGAREERDGDTFHCQEGGQAPGKGMRVEEGAACAKPGLRTGRQRLLADEASGWGGGQRGRHCGLGGAL